MIWLAALIGLSTLFVLYNVWFDLVQGVWLAATSAHPVLTSEVTVPSALGMAAEVAEAIAGKA